MLISNWILTIPPKKVALERLLSFHWDLFIFYLMVVWSGQVTLYYVRESIHALNLGFLSL